MNISEATRKDIFQHLMNNEIRWSGDLHDIAFLKRIYELDTLPSTDHRYDDAEGDIYQHRVNNPGDWDDYWIFDDERFKLRTCPDEELLRFLCEMVHPLVRGSRAEVDALVEILNDYLRDDGYELVVLKKLGCRFVYTHRRLSVPGAVQMAALRDPLVKLDADYVAKQVQRMNDAIEPDPALAIGTAKELIETACRTILANHGETVTKGTDLPELMKRTTKLIGLAPDDIPEAGKASKTIKVLLSNLCTVANGIAELRNAFGTGHGKAAASKGLRPRHAKLAAGAAATLAVFLLETHDDRTAKKKVSGVKIPVI
jgi:hypothetical protein